jgi:iron complex transport system substrate-binding protein
LGRAAAAVGLGTAAFALVVHALLPGSLTAPAVGVARRVVSLSPSTTEALFAIGAGDAVVGRSRYCDFPPQAASVPSVGGYVDPNLEAVLGLAPALVTGARGPAGPAFVDRLAARGIATYFPVTESFAGIDAMITGLGQRTGHEDRAARVVAALTARLAEVARAVESRPLTRTLLVFGIDPIVAAGPKGFAAEMLRAAGGENVVTEGDAYPTLGIERVLVLAPDVVVDAAAEEAGASRGAATSRIATAPGWRELAAVRAGRVVLLHDERVLRPGPRAGEGAAVLARALHPDVAIP